MHYMRLDVPDSPIFGGRGSKQTACRGVRATACLTPRRTSVRMCTPSLQVFICPNTVLHAFAVFPVQVTSETLKTLT